MLAHFIFLIVIAKCILSSAEQFGHCLKKTPHPGLMSCVGQQALSSLNLIEEQNNFTLTNGLIMIKDSSLSSRSIPNFLDQDPMDFRGILENAGAVIGRRTLQWDLSMIYPGLCLRVGPSSDSNSVLEFMMDPNSERGDNRYMQEDTSTGRILTRQFLLPFLLGIKFNLVTVLPLIFAGIILLCKKAALLGKFALFISGLLGFGGLFSLSNFGGLGSGGLGGLGGLGGGFQGIRPHRPSFFGDSVGVTGISNDQHNPLSGGYYKTDDKRLSSTPVHENVALINDNFYDYEKKVLLQDRKTQLFEKDGAENQEKSPNTYRSFAWTTIQ